MWVQSWNVSREWECKYGMGMWVRSGNVGTEWECEYGVGMWVQIWNVSREWECKEWECEYGVDTWVQSRNVSTVARNWHVWRLTVTRNLNVFWQNVHRSCDDRCMFTCLLRNSLGRQNWSTQLQQVAGGCVTPGNLIRPVCLKNYRVQCKSPLPYFQNKSRPATRYYLISLSVSFKSTMLIEVEQGSKASWAQAAACINKPFTKSIYKLRSRQAIWYPCSK